MKIIILERQAIRISNKSCKFCSLHVERRAVMKVQVMSFSSGGKIHEEQSVYLLSFDAKRIVTYFYIINDPF